MTPATEQRKYELMVILSGEIPESDAAKEMDELRKLLKENSGAVSFEDVWGKREFSYRLKRQMRGYYAVFNFMAGPETVAELRTAIRLNPLVLRHLLIIVPENYTPVRFEKEAVFEERPAYDRKPRSRIPAPVSRYSPIPAAPEPAAQAAGDKEATRVAGKEEEEKLKKVEKKLEEILENPDIDIR